eukprot:g2964.t1
MVASKQKAAALLATRKKAIRRRQQRMLTPISMKSGKSDSPSVKLKAHKKGIVDSVVNLSKLKRFEECGTRNRYVVQRPEYESQTSQTEHYRRRRSHLVEGGRGKWAHRRRRRETNGGHHRTLRDAQQNHENVTLNHRHGNNAAKEAAKASRRRQARFDAAIKRRRKADGILYDSRRSKRSAAAVAALGGPTKLSEHSPILLIGDDGFQIRKPPINKIRLKKNPSQDIKRVIEIASSSQKDNDKINDELEEARKQNAALIKKQKEQYRKAQLEQEKERQLWEQYKNQRLQEHKSGERELKGIQSSNTNIKNKNKIEERKKEKSETAETGDERSPVIIPSGIVARTLVIDAKRDRCSQFVVAINKLGFPADGLLGPWAQDATSGSHRTPLNVFLDNVAPALKQERGLRTDFLLLLHAQSMKETWGLSARAAMKGLLCRFDNLFVIVYFAKEDSNEIATVRSSTIKNMKNRARIISKPLKKEALSKILSKWIQQLVKEAEESAIAVLKEESNAAGYSGRKFRKRMNEFVLAKNVREEINPHKEKKSYDRPITKRTWNRQLQEKFKERLRTEEKNEKAEDSVKVVFRRQHRRHIHYSSSSVEARTERLKQYQRKLKEKKARADKQQRLLFLQTHPEIESERNIPKRSHKAATTTLRRVKMGKSPRNVKEDRLQEAAALLGSNSASFYNHKRKTSSGPASFYYHKQKARIKKDEQSSAKPRTALEWLGCRTPQPTSYVKAKETKKEIVAPESLGLKEEPVVDDPKLAELLHTPSERPVTIRESRPDTGSQRYLNEPAFAFKKGDSVVSPRVPSRGLRVCMRLEHFENRDPRWEEEGNNNRSKSSKKRLSSLSPKTRASPSSKIDSPKTISLPTPW